METNHLKIVPNPPQISEKVVTLLETFLSGRNKNTEEAYRKDLDSFMEFLRLTTPIAAVNVLFSSNHGDANLLAFNYKNSLITQGLQAATVNRKLAVLRSLSKLARTFGVASWKLEVQNMKAEAYRDTRGPGRTAFQELLAQVEGKCKPKCLRDHAILRLLHDLALRASELTNLDLTDLDLGVNSISVIGKGRTQKTLMTLPNPTREALSKWVEVRGSEPGPLFINFNRASKGKRLSRVGLYELVRGLGEKIGIKARPHGLRHLSITEGCRLAQANGYGLEEVLDHSRHASVATLMIYRDRDRNVQGQIANLVAGIKGR